MSTETTTAGLITDIESQNVRHLRQSKRRGLAITVNLIANGTVTHVTLENVSNTGLGLRGVADLQGASEVQVQLPNGRVLDVTVCWSGHGRIGTKLAERLAQDDPLLQAEGSLAFSDPVPARAAGSAMVLPFQFSSATKEASDGPSILVGDGFRSICYLLKGILERAGNNVDFVENGLAMVEAARIKAYDVVLIDSHMPLMSGDVVAAQIRRLPGAFGQCSIIAVSAETLDDRHFRSQGDADAYLSKPIHPGRLLEQVAAVRARKALEREMEREMERAADTQFLRSVSAA
jgi:CheY-like chemotaxis protein